MWGGGGGGAGAVFKTECLESRSQGSNVESCVWREVSPHSSHHPQEVLVAQFSLYVHKGGIKPHSFHFIFLAMWNHICE